MEVTTEAIKKYIWPPETGLSNEEAEVSDYIGPILLKNDVLEEDDLQYKTDDPKSGIDWGATVNDWIVFENEEMLQKIFILCTKDLGIKIKHNG